MRMKRRLRPCRTETDKVSDERCGRAAPYGRPGRSWMLAAVALVAFLQAVPAAACPVCYGEASGDMIDGAKLSVLFLGGLVYLVIGGGAGAVIALRRRVRKNLDARRGLHLMPPPEESRS